MAAEASREVVELATAINAPVVTTQQAKGIIPEDHPLSLGAYYYGHCPGYRAMARADVILAVGSRLHVVPSVPWAFQPHQVVVHIDADPAELGRNVPTRVAIEADARLGLQALLSELGGSRTKSEWAPGEASAARDEGYRRFKEMAPAQVGIVQALRRELEDDAIVVSGITTIGYWSNLVFPVLRPRSYLTSSYFATLGFAFPTAIGAKIGSPGRQVVALCGDGGFMYGVAGWPRQSRKGSMWLPWSSTTSPSGLPYATRRRVSAAGCMVPGSTTRTSLASSRPSAPRESGSRTWRSWARA